MKRVVVLLISLLIVSQTFAQFEQYERQQLGKKQKDTTAKVSKFVFGGDFGLQLGTNTLIRVSPALGHYITSYFLAGVSMTYVYSSNKYFHTRGNIYGGSAFVEAYPLSYVVLHGEYERLRIDFNYTTQPYWTKSYLAGIGYRQKIGTKGMINYLILWDFNYSNNSIYSNPRFKIIMLF